ncbi:hypothetical protein [Streptomyces ardesiacus]|uniref:hypothetical protein n=1 Tax=Streptomyces ardesiacus TaxID=285564 RepID=UPI003664A43D
MFKVGDKVEAFTDDRFNGAFGEVVEIAGADARILLDHEDVPLWFYFSELRKVEG